MFPVFPGVVVVVVVVVANGRGALEDGGMGNDIPDNSS